MNEPVTLEDVADAARMLALGMRPKLLPSRDLSYADLVKRFGEDDAFKDIAETSADGLGLTILALSPRTGVVLGPQEDSVFEQRLDDYARRAALGERRDLEKVLHGLAHLAAAALAFPRPDDLAADTYVGRVTVEQVDSVVREACSPGARPGPGGRSHRRRGSPARPWRRPAGSCCPACGPACAGRSPAG